MNTTFQSDAGVFFCKTTINLSLPPHLARLFSSKNSDPENQDHSGTLYCKNCSIIIHINTAVLWCVLMEQFSQYTPLQGEVQRK